MAIRDIYKARSTDMLGGCNTTDSLPSTGSSEPGAHEAADPPSTLLLVLADPATTLLLIVALGFPSKPLIVLLDHAERGVGRLGAGAGVWAGAGASLCPHVHKEVLRKRNPKYQKEQRTKNEHEKKSRYFLGGIQCRQYLLGGIQYRRCLLYTSPSPRDKRQSRMPSSA